LFLSLEKIGGWEKYLKNKQNQKLNRLSTNYLVKMFGL
jgi:hypothetical protein